MKALEGKFDATPLGEIDVLGVADDAATRATDAALAQLSGKLDATAIATAARSQAEKAASDALLREIDPRGPAGSPRRSSRSSSTRGSARS